MVRSVPTSQGQVVIEFNGKGWGLVRAFDANGWERGVQLWHEERGGYPQSLSQALRMVAGLSEDELARVVAETEAQYHERGGAVAEPQVPATVKVGMWALAVLAGAVLMGIGFLIATLT